MSAKDQIKQIVDFFKREPYLRDKTDGMAEGLLLGANLADEANERSLEVDSNFKRLQQEYTENGNGAQSAAELIAARDGEEVINDRLIRDFGNVVERVEQTNRNISNIVRMTQFPRLSPEITDDGRLQRAIAATDLGGLLSLENGYNYEITKALIIQGNITIQGNHATIKAVGTGFINDCVISITGSYAHLKSFTLSKDSTLETNAGIRITGVQHVLEDIRSFNSKWKIFIHAYGLSESHFNRIRVDNMVYNVDDATSDSTTLFGDIIRYDYANNCTLSNSFLSRANRGVYSSNTASSKGKYSEGVMTQNNTIIVTNTAVHIEFGTFITVTNSVLDFCMKNGVVMNKGNTSNVIGNWIQVREAGGYAVKADIEMSRIQVANNEIFGSGLAVLYAFMISAHDSIIADNSIRNMHGGQVNDVNGTATVVRDNIVVGGEPVKYANRVIEKWVHGYQIIKFDIDNCLIEIEAYEEGTSNYMYAVGTRINKNYTPKLFVVKNEGIVTGVGTNDGTQQLIGYSNVNNLHIRYKQTLVNMG